MLSFGVKNFRLRRRAAFALALAVIFVPFGNVDQSFASAGAYTLPVDSDYTEDSGAVQILPGFTITDAGQNYAGGDITFALSESYESGEALGLSESAFSDSGSTITVSEGSVFKSGSPIGNIDGSLNGQSEDLRINFTNSFSNGDFSQGTTGWSVGSERVNLGYVNDSGSVVPSTSTIAGYTPPIDFVWPDNGKSGDRTVGDAQGWDRASDVNRFTYSGSVVSGGLVSGTNDTSCGVDGCILRGPAVVSNSSVYLQSGDTVSLDWSATGSGDHYDVFGYLVKVNGDDAGRAFKLLDATGRTGNGSVSITIGSSVGDPFSSYGQGSYSYDLLESSPGNARGSWGPYTAQQTGHYSATDFIDDNDGATSDSFAAGSYKFVFVSGTYDASFGKRVGAKFEIDNIVVSGGGGGITVDADDVRDLARLVTYSNTTGANSSRTLTFSSSNSDSANSERGDSKTISVSQINDAPSLATPTPIALDDTSDVDTFSSIARSLSATDEEGDAITYGPNSQDGSYGSISVASDGTLTFTPDAEAINALDSDQSETFTLTASDGSATGTATLTVSITATVDTLPSAPVLGSITGANQSLSVVFSPPASAGATAIENYKYSTDGENYVAFDPAQTTSPLTIETLSVDGSTPLTNGVDIPVSLKAVNSGGDSPASNSVTASAEAPPAPRSGGGAVTTEATGSGPVLVPPRRAVTPAQANLPVTRQGPVLRNGVAPRALPVPQVRVGGLATVVETEVPDSSRLAVRFGRTALDVQVDQGDGSVATSEDGKTEIAVRKGGNTTLSGSGWRPQSTVQVFLPLQGSNAKELTRISVGDDGAFSGDALFATAPAEQPMPVGPQVLQLVSVDEAGNEVVLEMTVNIAQPAPTPEFNRLEGVVPTQAPGTSIATNAGVPEQVTVSAVEDQKLAVVEGEGWSMAIGVLSEDGAVQSAEGGASITLVRDESAQVSGDGFMPGTRADVWLFSDPTLLGTVTIDDEGRFDGEVNIDGRVIAVGEHTLQLQGVGADGYVRAANMGVTVGDANVAAEATAATSLTFLWWSLLAVVVAFLIIAAVVRRRRRA